jgi:two-component system chemotaxis response regulator CheY
MPEMDGFTFIDEMFKHDLLSHTPILIITSETREEELNQLRETRANGIITKPFRVEEIKNYLNIIFGEEIFNAGTDDEFEGCDF